MPSTFTYPTNYELSLIAQEKQAVLTMGQDADPIFQIMPIENSDSHLVEWEQKDNYIGLQQARGLNGAPARVQAVGGKKFQMVPGVYGEYNPIDELELTTRRPLGVAMGSVNINDLAIDRQDQLLNRRIDRIRYIGWTLLCYGIFSIAAPNGAVVHADSYTMQTYTASVAWSTAATSTPLADLRAIKLLARGKGVNFGRSAKLYINQATANNLMKNTNASDLAGKRTTGLAQPLSLDEINTLLAGEDLPKIVVWDDGYFDDSNTFQLFIPNSVGVLVGARPAGQTIAKYKMTRNVNNPDMAPGPYMKIVDNGDRAVPRLIEVHDGHNGGPALYYPSSIVRLSV